MPGITQPQWDAIRRTAAAVGRDAAKAEWAKVDAKRKKPKDNDRYRCSASGEWFTYAAGEWRRESEADFRLRTALGLSFFETTPPRHVVFGEPCKMNFKLCPPIEYHDESKLGRFFRTHPLVRPELHFGEYHLPTTGFYMVADARCFPEGAGTDANHPWLVHPPKVMYATEDFAIQEAQRLSLEHGVPFIVLSSIKMVDVKPATTVQTDMAPVER